MAVSENPSSFPDGSDTDLSFNSSSYTPPTPVDEPSADQRTQDADAMFDNRIAQIDPAPESFALEKLQAIEAASQALVGKINLDGNKINGIQLEKSDSPQNIVLGGKTYLVTHFFYIQAGSASARMYLILPGISHVYISEEGRIATSFGQNEISDNYRFDGESIVVLSVLEGRLEAVNQIKKDVEGKFKKAYPDKFFTSDVLEVAEELGVDISELQSLAGTKIHEKGEYTYNPKFGIAMQWTLIQKYNPDFNRVLTAEKTVLKQLDTKLTQYLPENLETTIGGVNDLKVFTRKLFELAYPNPGDPSTREFLSVAEGLGIDTSGLRSLSGVKVYEDGEYTYSPDYSLSIIWVPGKNYTAEFYSILEHEKVLLRKISAELEK